MTQTALAISSLSERECSPTTTSTTDPFIVDDISTVTEDPGDKNITPIIAGATIAIVVVVLIIAVTVFAIVFLVLKNRSGELSLKKSESK